MKQEESKYVKAIREIGEPSSPKMIRDELNKSPDQVTAQNVASALNSLLARKRVKRLENGLYVVISEKQ